MSLQNYVDDQVKKLRQQMLANSDQLTLGKLIQKIELIQQKGYKCYDGSDPVVFYDFANLFPTSINSWRGSYGEFALNFTTEGNNLSVIEFLNLLKSALGKSFEGYKGGNYTMDEDTPLWVANWGCGGSTAVVDALDFDSVVIIVTGYREF